MRVTMDDGVALEVTDAGSGPALVLVHGFGGAKEDFADHIEVLAERYRVITLDHRGHGESDGPTELDAYSLDRMAADVLGVADALGIDGFRLLGHSMGGMVARRVVLAHPERVDALVLMDTSPGPVPGIDPQLAELAAQMAREIVHQPNQLALLAEVRCPTLVIVGAEDESFVEPSRQMSTTIPGAELVVVPDAGHSPQFENPRAWFDAVAGFLASVERAPA